MSVTVTPALPARLPALLAALYGAPEEAVAWMAAVLNAAWVARDEGGGLVGAVGTRPSPVHGAELVGGTLPGPGQYEGATALAAAAWQAAGRAYAFADGALLTRAALEAAGYREVGAYRLLAGPTPEERAGVPPGLQLWPLADVPDPARRLDALATYEDRIGHHAVTPDAAANGAGGFDPQLSLIALDPAGRAAGICRAAPEDGYARIDAPGVRADLRSGGLRAALLLGVCARVSARGLPHVSVESWGDTPEELAQDLALGLGVEVENPILAAGRDPGGALR